MKMIALKQIIETKAATKILKEITQYTIFKAPYIHAILISTNIFFYLILDQQILALFFIEINSDSYLQ